jgi:hypothetical protein
VRKRSPTASTANLSAFQALPFVAPNEFLDHWER